MFFLEMYKSIKNLAGIALVALSVASCDSGDTNVKTSTPFPAPSPKKYSFQNLSVPGNFERPGISGSNYGNQLTQNRPQAVSPRAVNPSDLEGMIVSENGTFTFPDGSQTFVDFPKIRTYSDGNLITLYTFLLSDIDRFRTVTPLFFPPEGVYRYDGISSLTAILESGKIFHSTNVSRIISGFNNLGDDSYERESPEFLDADEILGTSSFALSEDGSILYLGQQPLISGGNVVRPKGVLPIDLSTKTVGTFIPIDTSSVQGNIYSDDIPTQKYGTVQVATGEQVKIVVKDGDIYALDNLAHRIYKIPNGNGIPEVLASMRNPMAISSRSDGKLVVQTGPCFSSDASLLQQSPELFELDTLTGESVNVHTIESVFDEFDTQGNAQSVDKDGTSCQFPTGFEFSTPNKLVKNPDGSWTFVVGNSHISGEGAIKAIQATLSP